MGERYITGQVRTYSSGTPWRVLCAARTNHFVADDVASHGGPGEAVNAVELFLSGITACAVLMFERLARQGGIPLRRADVSMEGTIDTEAVREGPSVLDRARIRCELAGVSEAQARDLVETYKRR